MSAIRSTLILAFAIFLNATQFSPLAGAAEAPGPVDKAVLYADGAGQAFSAPMLGRTASSALLLWGDELAAHADHYAVIRNGKEIAETKRRAFVATQLTPGQTYSFRIRAFDANGKSLGRTPVLTAATREAQTVFDVKRRGAVGDGRHRDTDAIQQSIDACTPDGMVFVPPGVYLVGHLELKSDLTFFLSPGAVLRFLAKGEASYPDKQDTVPGPDGDIIIRSTALWSGHHVSNLTIMGGGVVQGNGPSWWPPKSPDDRPHLLDLTDGKNVLIQGIKIEDPPSWNLHVAYIDHAVFADLTLLKRSKGPGTNGDGLDPDSCRDVLIVGCVFGNQDDSIAIKSGKLTDQQPRRQRSCESIVIRDCRFDGNVAPGSHPLGIGIGSETCGGVRHVRVNHCEFVEAASLMNIKSNRDRNHAVVEDVVVADCTFQNTMFPDEPWNRAPIVLDMFYFNRAEDPNKPASLTAATPAFRDIHFRNLTIHNPKGRAVYIHGLPERPIQGLSFTDIKSDSLVGWTTSDVNGITFDRVEAIAREGVVENWERVRNRQGSPQSRAQKD